MPRLPQGACRTHPSDPPVPPVLAHAETPFYRASQLHRAFDRPIPRLELAGFAGNPACYNDFTISFDLIAAKILQQSPVKSG